MSLRILDNDIGIRRVAALLLVLEAAPLLQIVRMAVVMKSIIVRVGLGDHARLVVGGADGVGDIVVVGCLLGVVQRGVVVLVRNIERGVVVACDARHGGAVVQVAGLMVSHVGHFE